MVFPLVGVGAACLVAAVVAALFGFGAVSDDSPLLGKLTSAFFLLLALASFWWAWMGRAVRTGIPVRQDRRTGERIPLAPRLSAEPPA
jgi:hypothetical protein